jgi:hypothetical protein
MAAVVAREVEPEAIILFGSHATGDARPDSDVDLMVVESTPFGPDRDRRREMTRHCPGVERGETSLWHSLMKPVKCWLPLIKTGGHWPVIGNPLDRSVVSDRVARLLQIIKAMVGPTRGND